MKTILHHTCEQTGGDTVALRDSPFFAEHNPDGKKYQFLGSGYYFWENNIELAKVWGKGHYNNNYYVITLNFELTTATCYDLLGNRSHQLHMQAQMKTLKDHLGVDKSTEWTLNQYIQMMRELNKEDPNVFPYKFVRAVDLLKHESYKKAQLMIKFINEKDNYTIINPKIVIFAFDKKDLDLSSKTLVV